MTQAKTEEPTQVVLIKDGHTHQGKPCQKGETITVTHSQKQWLQQHGLIAADDKQAPKSSPKPTTKK